MAWAGKGRGRAIAVLTGDLVRSSDLPSADLARARAALELAGRQMGKWAENAVVGPVEFFRGDAWQLALGAPRFFLRAAILVRAQLRAQSPRFDSRIGVGLGLFEELNSDRTSLSTGEAFTISGKALDGLAGGSGVAVAVPDRLHDQLGWATPLTALCSATADHWTERQASLVARMLETFGIQQSDVASQLEVTRQLISKQLLAADFAALSGAVDYVERLDWPKELARAPYRAI